MIGGFFCLFPIDVYISRVLHPSFVPSLMSWPKARVHGLSEMIQFI